MHSIKPSTDDFQEPLISLSVVSHGQAEFVERMLASLAQHQPDFPIEIVLTENIPAPSELQGLTLPFPVHTIRNPKPKGFAANHNQAFERARGAYFAFANPDLIFIEDVLTPLLRMLESKNVDIISPLVINSESEVQDSFRHLPSPLSLLMRQLHLHGRSHKAVLSRLVYPEWIAGIFLLMHTGIFTNLSGLDPSYHLYFEDVDFSCRARLAGYKIGVTTEFKLVHDAQRRSKRNLHYLILHLRSAARFFASPIYWKARTLNKSPNDQNDS